MASIATLYILEYHRRHHSQHQHSTIPNSLLSPTNAGGNHIQQSQQQLLFDHQNLASQYTSSSSANTINYHQLNNPVNNIDYNIQQMLPLPQQTNYHSNSITYHQLNPMDVQQSRQTAFIPVLKPQVLGARYGCYDFNSLQSSCPVHCCLEENYNVYHLNSNIEPTMKDQSKSFHTKLNEDDKSASIIILNNTSTVIGNNTGGNTSSLSTHSTTSTQAINTPSAGVNYFDQNHSKFDSPEMIIMKKKRTDKGISFNGKYSNAGTGIQDIHFDYHSDIKSNQYLKRQQRRKRETTGKLSPNNMHSTYPRKDLTRTVEIIKLLELNATIDYTYCTKLQCTQGLGSKFHYIIPISKYMDLEYVTLQFG